MKSDYDYENDFDDFEVTDKAINKKNSVPERSIKDSKVDTLPTKVESTPKKNIFTNPKTHLGESMSLRSSAQDSIAKTIIGNSNSKNQEPSNQRSPFQEKKNPDFFDKRAKPAAIERPKPSTIEKPKPSGNDFNISEDISSDDYQEDFENVQDADYNQVADKILNDIKSPTSKPKVTGNKTQVLVNKPIVDKQAKAQPSKINFNPPVKKASEKKEKEVEKVKEERKNKASFIQNKPKTHSVSKPAGKSVEPVLKARKAALPQSTVKPKAKSKLRTSVEQHADPVALEHLANENIKLLEQVTNLAKQVDLQVLSARRLAAPSVISTTTREERLKSKREQMDDNAHKIKEMQKEIKDMYSVLEGTLHIDQIVKQENKIKSQLKTLKKQELSLKDCKKAIRGQNRFFKQVEKTNEKTGHTEDINQHYEEAKIKFRELKEIHREKDRILKEKH